MGDLSEHFSSWEFLEHGSGKRKDPPRELLEVLERLRAGTGRPMRIVSGYRSPEYNARIGGARRSQHLLGKAADIESGRVTVDQAVRAGARGIGHCRGWVVHVDVRPASSPVIFEDC